MDLLSVPLSDVCPRSAVYTLMPCLMWVAATHKDTSQLSPSAIHISPSSTQTWPMNEHSLGQGGSCCWVWAGFTAVFTELFLTQFLILSSQALSSEPPFTFLFSFIFPGPCFLFCFFRPFSLYLSFFSSTLFLSCAHTLLQSCPVSYLSPFVTLSKTGRGPWLIKLTGH